ncbi:MAG: MlaD family protein [Magnetococcus sp. MYC-9]
MPEVVPSWKSRDRRFKQVTSAFVFTSMILMLGILWLGNTTAHPFDAKYTLFLELAHADGLKKDTPVTLAGIMVGRVADLQLTADNKIRVTLRLLKKHMERIRDDSHVTLIKPMVGNASLDISLGSPETRILQHDQSIRFGKGSDVSDMLVQLPAILADVQQILSNTKNLTGQLLDPADHVQKSMAHLHSTLADVASLAHPLSQKAQTLQNTADNLEHLSREAADLMRTLHTATPQMMAGLHQAATQSIRQVEQTVAEMQKSLQMVQPLVAQLQSMLQTTNQIAVDVSKVTEQLGKLSPEIPVFVHQGTETMRETETLMRRVNNSVLLGGSGGKEGGEGRLMDTPRDLPTLPTSDAP